MRVVAPPYITDNERLKLDIRQSTLVLMPSRAEGFGLVGAEAITAGVPVLISEESGLGELVTSVWPAAQNHTVLPANGDDEQVVRRWGTAIVRVLQGREAAFESADRLRRTMSRERTWSMAANVILDELRRRSLR